MVSGVTRPAENRSTGKIGGSVSAGIPRMKIAALGSHSALQILKGAKDEGFRTVCVCLAGKEKPYRSFRVADEIILIDRYEDFLALDLSGSVLIPHASLISYLGAEAVQKIRTPYFGDKGILLHESDRVKQASWLASAGLTLPREFASPDDIDRQCIIKFHGAKGGKGYFLAATPQEFQGRIKAHAGSGGYTIQEYIVGVPVYIHYFHSPLTGELELMGFDRRYESNVDGLGRIAAADQLSARVEPSYHITGNLPLVLRESLLPDVFEMGERVVAASKRLSKKGLFGAFCLETVLTPDLKFFVFEISARIVAGTNLYTDGSPYTALRYSEPMSTGRRICREIRLAIEQDRLDEVLG